MVSGEASLSEGKQHTEFTRRNRWNVCVGGEGGGGRVLFMQRVWDSVPARRVALEELKGARAGCKQKGPYRVGRQVSIQHHAVDFGFYLKKNMRGESPEQNQKSCIEEDS